MSLWCGVVWFGVVWCGVVYCVALCCVVLRCVALCCVVLCCVVVCRVVLLVAAGGAIVSGSSDWCLPRWRSRDVGRGVHYLGWVLVCFSAELCLPSRFPALFCVYVLPKIPCRRVWVQTLCCDFECLVFDRNKYLMMMMTVRTLRTLRFTVMESHPPSPIRAHSQA